MAHYPGLYLNLSEKYILHQMTTSDFKKVIKENNGVLPKWSRTFIEFSEFSKFRESDKSLKHELGLI